MYSKLSPEDEWLIYSKHVEDINWNKFKKKVHLVGSYYADCKHLSLCVISHHAAEVDRAVQAHVYTFFVSYLDKHCLSASLPRCFMFGTVCAEWLDTSQFEGHHSGSCLRCPAWTVITKLTELMWHLFPKTGR